MKRMSIKHTGIHLLFISLCTTGILIFLAYLIIAELGDRPKDRPSDDLLSYIQKLEGNWIRLNSDPELDFVDDFWIKIQTDWVEGDKVRIFVSEYCRLGIADYLLFELYEHSLCYIAAVDGAYIYQPLYLDFAELKYEIIDNELVLIYESVEAEKENYFRRRLVRTQDSVRQNQTINYP